jgi:hypothetical protein
MQFHTIVNAWKESGVWPPSAKQGIKKMRLYQKKKRTIDDIKEELELLPHLPIRPPEMWNTIVDVRALEDRDPTTYSKGTIQKFYITMKSIDIVLQKAHLTTIEHGALQAKLLEDHKRKSKSRRSIHKGGPSAEVDDLRAKIKARDEKENTEALRKAKKKLTIEVNRAKNKLKAAGVQARKDEQARL